MNSQNQIQFNPKVRLILADVDETVAGIYLQATQAMIYELDTLLEEKKVLFLISGGGLQSIRERITDLIDPKLRHRVIVAHCMGAEVWGFQKNGDLNGKPYYGIYDTCLTAYQKKQWRIIINDAILKFHLKVFSTQPQEEFIRQSNGDALTVMLADRGPQITFEFTNSVHLSDSQKEYVEKKLNIVIPKFDDSYDLRVLVINYLNSKYQDAHLPIESRFGGTSSVDNIIGGVNKTKAIHFILSHSNILQNLDFEKNDIKESDEIEIWGDKFGQKKGGPDFDMCLAVSPKVRAIDFRKESPDEIPKNYNIQLWTGKKELHSGLLEYLQSR